ncbi:hypothetical protein SLT36_31085 (plasmid) [Aminobacter sp. BA135]|uniref:hypothetical protein n=1 Tax=Aminobacter sp. BA135 TaxID=537596 RepID=UPI003D79A5DE
MRALLFQRFGPNGTHCEVITRMPTGMARKSSTQTEQDRRTGKSSAGNLSKAGFARQRDTRWESEGYVCICARSTSARNKQFTTVNRLANGHAKLSDDGLRQACAGTSGRAKRCVSQWWLENSNGYHDASNNHPDRIANWRRRLVRSRPMVLTLSRANGVFM